MITKFNIYNESLLNKLEGPSKKDALEKNPTSVLIQAINNDDIELFRLALEYGADTNKSYHTNNTQWINIKIITYVIEKGKEDFAKLLIDYGVNIRGNQTLQTIGEYASLDLIKYILDRIILTYEEYNNIIRFNRIRENEKEKGEVLSLINSYIQKNVTKDVSKPWKPYVGVHDQPINKFVKKYFDENE